MSAGEHPTGRGPDPLDHRPIAGRRPQALTFMIVLTVVVVAFAAIVALWMYWLGGALRV